MLKDTYRNNSIYKVGIFLTLLGGTALGARGDLISTEIIATRSVNNNQAFIDYELGQIVADEFSIDPVQFGYWLYKITYETIDIHGDTHIATGSVCYPRVEWPNVPDQAFPGESVVSSRAAFPEEQLLDLHRIDRW